jgi:hypothetical protein
MFGGEEAPKPIAFRPLAALLKAKEEAAEKKEAELKAKDGIEIKEALSKPGFEEKV